MCYALVIVTWVPTPLGPMSGFVRDLTPLIELWFFRLTTHGRGRLEIGKISMGNLTSYESPTVGVVYPDHARDGYF